MKNSNNIPVLIFGSGLTVLGTLRALARHGITVYCADRQPDFVRRSRWYRTVNLPVQAGDPESITAFADSIGHQKLVLIPASDNSCLDLSAETYRNSDRLLTFLPDRDKLDILIRKDLFALKLAELSVDSPRTAILNTAEELADIDDSVIDSAFLKPVDSQKFGADFSVKAWQLSGRKEAVELMQKAEKSNHRMLLQEYVPGDQSEHYFIDGFLDVRGEFKGLLARKRLRMYPPLFGNSSYFRSVESNLVSSAIEDLSRLLMSIKFHGIFSAEFKFDSRDGKYKLIEINARPWWFIGFADSLQVNVALMYYATCVGNPVPTSMSYKAGQYFVYPSYDEPNCRELHREGKLSLIEWARQWTRAHQAVFALDDPWPSIVGVSLRILREIRQRLGLSINK